MILHSGSPALKQILAHMLRCLLFSLPKADFFSSLDRVGYNSVLTLLCTCWALQGAIITDTVTTDSQQAGTVMRPDLESVIHIPSLFLLRKDVHL